MPYWARPHAHHGGSWMVANRGIDGLMFVDGDAMGLRYVSASSQPEPPDRSPAGICPPPQPKPAPSSTTSPTAAPSAGTATSSGRAVISSPSPVATASPTDTASATPIDLPAQNQPTATPAVHLYPGRQIPAPRGPELGGGLGSR